MSKNETGGQAFPASFSPDYPHEITGGMSLRQYAAIKLKVPDSGTDWLDEMINQSLRDDFAAKVMQAHAASQWEKFYRLPEEGNHISPFDVFDGHDIAELAYDMADEMLTTRSK